MKRVDFPEERSATGRQLRSLNIDFKKLAGECYDDEIDASGDNIFTQYANKHIRSLLQRAFTSSSNILQTVTDGSTLTASNLIDPSHTLSIHNPILIKDTPVSIGMKVPRPKGDPQNEITIREIGEIIGMKHNITVMDVRTQDELEGWNFEDMVNYFEDDDRKYIPTSPSRSTKARRHLRRVLNQISLEFSATPLAAFVKSPQFVRDVDWIEHMWSTARKEERPRVQYYCLTSTSGCFTDFHVDFGGTSVWYHVLSGKKVFLLVPPTKQNMALYEKWLCRKDQGDIFFPDMRGVMPVEEYDENELDAEGVNGEEEQVGVEDCVRITLVKGQTFIIPTGWIHAVYTPVDSLVLGGNFLHGFDVKGQLDVHCLETRTRVPAKFRFPSFVQLCFYAGAEYFKRLKNPAKYGKIWKEELNGINHLVNALRSWNVGPGGDANRYGSVAYVESQIVQDLGILYGIVDMDEMLKGVEDGVTLKRNGLMDGVSKRGGVSVDRCQSPKGPTIKLSLLKRKASNLLIPSEQSSAAETISSPKPKIKLKLGGIMTVAQNVKLHYANNNDDEFPEMKISSSSRKVGNGRTATADLVSMQNRVVGDDEWLPDVTELTVMGTTSTYIQKSKNSPKQKALKKKWVPKEKPRGNSRSRLMKKFKF